MVTAITMIAYKKDIWAAAIGCSNVAGLSSITYCSGYYSKTTTSGTGCQACPNGGQTAATVQIIKYACTACTAGNAADCGNCTPGANNSWGINLWACDNGFFHVAENAAQTRCYLPASTNVTDSYGTYQFVANCYWTY